MPAAPWIDDEDGDERYELVLEMDPYTTYILVRYDDAWHLGIDHDDIGDPYDLAVYDACSPAEAKVAALRFILRRYQDVVEEMHSYDELRSPQPIAKKPGKRRKPAKSVWDRLNEED